LGSVNITIQYSAHDFLFAFHGNYLSIIFKLQQVICRKLRILIHPPVFGALLGMSPFVFHQDLWHKKTRIHALSWGIVFMIVYLAISVEH